MPDFQKKGSETMNQQVVLKPVIHFSNKNNIQPGMTDSKCIKETLSYLSFIFFGILSAMLKLPFLGI
jgi:hypothetical protein